MSVSRLVLVFKLLFQIFVEPTLVPCKSYVTLRNFAVILHVKLSSFLTLTIILDCRVKTRAPGKPGQAIPGCFIIFVTALLFCCRRLVFFAA